MHESSKDLAGLQQLIDRSYETAGPHLLRIHDEERRMSAEQVARRLTGMCLLSLATVTADCRPIVGPVDGIFYRGAFHFGSAPDSVRARHIRVRPHVSATHLPREELAVTVHGRAVPVDVRAEARAGLRRTLLEVYVPRVRARVGGVPRLRTGLLPDRGRADVHVRDLSGVSRAPAPARPPP